MIDQLEDYVLPRLVQIDAPLLDRRRRLDRRRQVDAGELAGRRAGQRARRAPADDALARARPPPRRRDVVRQAAHPARARAHHRATADPGALQLVASTAIPQGLALLDAPDIDSVEERNRSLAAQLLAAADLWLFVTSAARYADQVPVGLPEAGRRPQRRGGDRARPHPARRRRRGERPPRADAHPAGLKDSPLFTVAEGAARRGGTAARGRRSRTSAAGCTRWAPTSRPATRVVRQTLDGAVRSIARRTYELAEACAAQADMQARLQARRRHLLRPGARRTSTRAPPTAPCCAARCWRAGRSSSAPASCSATWSPRSAGCATGSPTRSRASRSRPSG